MDVDQTPTNSPVELFQELVAPAMRQLQIAHLALMGWAQQECERLLFEGSSLPPICRMKATVMEGLCYLEPSLEEDSPTTGLAVSLSVGIKLHVIKGEKPLTKGEVQKVRVWLNQRYQWATVKYVPGYFRILWSELHAKVSV